MNTVTGRKHGSKARQDRAARTSRIGDRNTSVIFESSSQVYLWTTDRGRSRLLKH